MHDKLVPSYSIMSEYAKSPSSEKSATIQAVYDIRSPEEDRLRSKLDKRILPLVCVLNAFCFLDRVNVGFASVAGLQTSLGLQGIQYNIALTCFYTTYVVVETPNNLLGKHFGMGRWLAGCTLGFGICCMCSAFVRTYAEFCLVRSHEWSQRAPNSIGSLKSWRNIFLIEGLITTVVAICIFFLIIDSPTQASWLTPEETILAVGRLEAEYPAVDEDAQHTRKQTIRQGLLDVNTWFVAVGIFFLNVAVQGSAVFLPTVIATLFPTKTTVEKQLLSVPPYFMAAVVQIIAPYISMRMDSRGPFMVFHAAVGVVAYAIFVGSKSLHARYAACFLVAAGPFPFGAFSPGLVAVKTGPDATRAVALGVLSSVGYLGGIVSTWTYVASGALDYRTGNTLNLAGMVTVLVLTVATMAHMVWENRKRARGGRDYRLDGLTPAEEARLGHLHPRFRYKI
ncbi:major facilitator superfamily domain-containing protein [Mycena vulgaris]|nr:major facilitator superfamily domain-containing protein [Mycena vulgaris]